MRIAKEERKATRGVTSAVNNLSFKNQCEALIGAVANPETHTDTHNNAIARKQNSALTENSE